MIVRFTPEARADLVEVGDYIALADRRSARTFVSELRQRCARLSDFPRRFPLVPRHEDSGVRHFSHGNYLVFYSVQERGVAILRVINGVRDYVRLLFPR